jgi:hypothetical protein
MNCLHGPDLAFSHFDIGGSGTYTVPWFYDGKLDEWVSAAEYNYPLGDRNIVAYMKGPNGAATSATHGYLLPHDSKLITLACSEDTASATVNAYLDVSGAMAVDEFPWLSNGSGTVDKNLSGELNARILGGSVQPPVPVYPTFPTIQMGTRWRNPGTFVGADAGGQHRIKVKRLGLHDIPFYYDEVNDKWLSVFEKVHVFARNQEPCNNQMLRHVGGVPGWTSGREQVHPFFASCDGVITWITCNSNGVTPNCTMRIWGQANLLHEFTWNTEQHSETPFVVSSYLDAGISIAQAASVTKPWRPFVCIGTRWVLQ